jgi:hypothetical protein
MTPPCKQRNPHKQEYRRYADPHQIPWRPVSTSFGTFGQPSADGDLVLCVIVDFLLAWRNHTDAKNTYLTPANRRTSVSDLYQPQCR